jgi:hypothetical protein
MRALLLALAASALMAGCGSDSNPSLPQGSEEVKLDPADFVDRVDNAYWPMAPGSRWLYREGEQRSNVTVTDKTKEILGISATVVHDLVTEQGELIEDTLDWYAQDKDGNVWYLGEATTEYENGRPTAPRAHGKRGSTARSQGSSLPPSPKRA